MRTALCFAALLSLAVPAQARDTPAAVESARSTEIVSQVDAILARAAVGTRYGIVVQRLDGTELLAVAPDQRFIPASNTKVYTTLAAYHELAALQRAAEGTGVLLEPAGNGGMVDVVLEGRGEATLSSAPDCAVQCLAVLADAVAARTKRVRKVVGDASWYPDERWSAGMSWNNIPFRYGTAVAALMVDDNELVVSATPGKAGEPVRVDGDGYFRIENRARTVPGDADNLSVSRMPGSDLIVLDGTIGEASEQSNYRLAIDDPAHRAAWRFAWMLEARGVKVAGGASAIYRPVTPMDDPAERGDAPVASPPRETMLASLTPEALAADIMTINKVSQNLHAEMMLRRVGKLTGTGSVADGQAAMGRMMVAAGLPADAVVLSDGSGMSSYNRASPRTTARLLGWAARQDWFEAWRSTLPVGGVDGTLARRFADTPLSGRLFAKTGSLNASRALSGYLVAASGETLVFSAFANDIPPDGEGAATAAMDSALLAIAAAF
jgi:D-alanyl-D-alanine carboxypeptidase/D-alanyl-D-alanine-endopeptidase (penicillin-binding protein 4)